MKEQISVLRSANDLCYPDHAFISPYTEAINQLTVEWINEYGCLNEDVKKKTGMAFYGTLTAEILPGISIFATKVIGISCNNVTVVVKVCLAV